ncbi:hypothetical protein ACFQX6_07380 [Streptosporangium lutulentum]
MTGHYVPQAGYYPLAPWTGLAVLCGYTALALVLAVLQLRRRRVRQQLHAEWTKLRTMPGTGRCCSPSSR